MNLVVYFCENKKNGSEPSFSYVLRQVAGPPRSHNVTYERQSVTNAASMTHVMRHASMLTPCPVGLRHSADHKRTRCRATPGVPNAILANTCGCAHLCEDSQKRRLVMFSLVCVSSHFFQEPTAPIFPPDFRCFSRGHDPITHAHRAT